MELVKQILDTAIAAALVGLLGYALTAFHSNLPQIEAALAAHVGEKNLQALQSGARMAVIYAEKQGLLGGLGKDGEAKKAIAIRFLQALADSRGIPVDVAEVDALVEAAWRDEFGPLIKSLIADAAVPAPQA